MAKKLQFSKSAVVAFVLFSVAMFAVAVNYVADRSYSKAEIIEFTTGVLR